jgi:hypothetical protein
VVVLESVASEPRGWLFEDGVGGWMAPVIREEMLGA